MKQIITGNELLNTINEAITLLCDTTKTTLGPKGNNVLISESNFSPYITNDGVTIAQAIESDDVKINAILEIAKEASLKTNETVGDGTTTTLVLLQALYQEGKKIIKEGKNPIVLKKELDIEAEKIIQKLKERQKKPNKKDLENIATVSVNDEYLGKFITNLYLKVLNKHAILLEESNTEETTFKLNKGYRIENQNISSLYFENEKEIILHQPMVLIIKGYLNNLEDISEIINEILRLNKDLVVFANDFSEEIKNEVLLLYKEQHKNIFLLDLPLYAKRLEEITKDIEFLTGAKTNYLDYKIPHWNDLGTLNSIKISKDYTTLISDIDTKKRVKELKLELKNQKEEYEIEFLQERIAKLENGILEIYIGAPTKVERREKKMRLEDAINALEVAKKGILPGGGISYLFVADSIEENSDGLKIIKKALYAPFLQIIKNAGLNETDILKELKKNNYQVLYNIKTEKYEDIETTQIIDPLNILTCILKNAISIAGMLLTLNYLVINEKEF